MRTFLQFPPGPAVACALCLVVPDQNDLKLSTVGLVVLDSLSKTSDIGFKRAEGVAVDPVPTTEQTKNSAIVDEPRDGLKVSQGHQTWYHSVC